jgi:hypothetical protein
LLKTCFDVLTTFNTKFKVNDEEEKYQVFFCNACEYFCGLQFTQVDWLIHSSYVTCTKITKTNDKMIGLSLNSKHQTKEPKQEHKKKHEVYKKKIIHIFLLW